MTYHPSERLDRSAAGAIHGRPWARAAGATGVGTAVLLVMVSVLVGAAAIWWRSGVSGQHNEGELLETVRRGDFRLEITESGEIESTGNTEVRCEVEANNSAGTAILRLVPEGTHVKAGDFLIQLDSSSLDKERIQQQILVNTSEALLVQARSDYETAQIALTEYVEGTFKQETEIIESEIFVAEENLRRAEEFLQYSHRLVAKGYVTRLQLEADEFSVEKSKKELDAARTKLGVLEKFTKQKMIKQLGSDIVSAKAQWEAEKSSNELEVGKLNDIEEQTAKCTIVAPCEGQVTYAHKYNYRDEVLIEEGTVVRERQVLVRLPDPSHMQVKIKINESVVDQVKIDMRASIRPVGRDDITLPGTVTRVNEYSEPTSRWEGNIKNYAAYVRIDRPAESLRTGMTAEVTIHCQDILGVLQVPVQAVYAHGPELAYCFVSTGAGWEQREVRVGPTNDSVVIITEGLSENDVVSLDPRRHLDEADLPELSAQELQQAVKPGPRLDVDERRGRVASDPSSSSSSPGSAADAFLRKRDKNKDGALAKEELPATMQAEFDAADTNRDGKLDGSELRAALSKCTSQNRLVVPIFPAAGYPQAGSGIGSKLGGDTARSGPVTSGGGG